MLGPRRGEVDVADHEARRCAADRRHPRRLEQRCGRRTRGYRQPRFGIELFHHALVGPDGITPSPGGRQFMQVIDEIEIENG